MNATRVLTHAGTAVVVGATVGAVGLSPALPVGTWLGSLGPLFAGVIVALPVFAALLVYDPDPERYEPVLRAGVYLLFGISFGLLAAVLYLLFGGPFPGGLTSIEWVGTLGGTAGAVAGAVTFLWVR